MATASWRRRRMSAASLRIEPRAVGSMPAQAPKAALAALTASSTVVSVAVGVSATTWSGWAGL